MNKIKPISIKSITESLEKYIKGQKEYVEFLGILGYKINLLNDDCISKKLLPIPLIIGPSGSGKTYGVKTLCDILDIPLYILDGSSISKTGYKGNNVAEFVTAIMKDYDPITPAICFIDEIDKCGEDYEVSAKSHGLIYSDFLKLLETDSVTSKNGTVDISNVIFIFGGSFDRINRIKNENNYIQHVGDIFNFNNKSEDKINEGNKDKEKTESSKITVDDLYKFGLNYEFLGRITNIIQTKPLSKEATRNILNNKDNPIIEEISNFFFDKGVERINISDDIFDKLLDKTTEGHNRNMGARNINSLLVTEFFDKALKLTDNINFHIWKYLHIYLENDEIAVAVKRSEFSEYMSIKSEKFQAIDEDILINGLGNYEESEDYKNLESHKNKNKIKTLQPLKGEFEYGAK